MKSYSQEALEKLLSREAGIVSLEEIIDWADQKFMLLNEYDDDLVNVCMVKKASAKEMLSLLRKLTNDCEEWLPMRCTMSKMYEILCQDRSRAKGFVRFLEQFWVRHGYEVPDDMEFMAGIDDEYHLAEQGIYGTIEQARQSLLDNLPKYKTSNEQANTTERYRGR